MAFKKGPVHCCDERDQLNRSYDGIEIFQSVSRATWILVDESHTLP